MFGARKIMREISVSLDIVSSTATLAELSSALGVNGSSGSHEKGDARPGHKSWEYTTWKCDSKVAEGSSLVEHFLSLFEQLPVSKLSERGVLPSDRKIYLNIAVMFDAAMCSVEIPTDCIRMLDGLDVMIEISCYPCAEAGASK